MFVLIWMHFFYDESKYGNEKIKLFELVIKLKNQDLFPELDTGMEKAKSWNGRKWEKKVFVS